jgi:hypothetical protein
MANKKNKESTHRENRLKDILFGVQGELKEAEKYDVQPCQYPSSTPCNEPAIAAHSVQNNGSLKEIADERGRVYTIKTEPMVGYPPKLPDFKRIHRNNATTFKGLCNPHDTELFRPIDQNPLDPYDSEHAFLMAYRSLLKEANTSMSVADMQQSAYDGLVNEGEISDSDKLHQTVRDQPREDAKPMLHEKKTLDRLYLTSNYNGLRHEVVLLPERQPTLAVSAFFSAGRIGNKECWCMLNILPYDGKHLILLSFKNHSELAVRKNFLNLLRKVDDREREKVASRLILENCANFAIAPSARESFSSQQQTTIRNYFWGTTAMEQARYLGQIDYCFRLEMEQMVRGVVGDLDPNDSRIDLFECVA